MASLRKLPDTKTKKDRYRVLINDSANGTRPSKVIYATSLKKAKEMAYELEKKYRETGSIDGRTAEEKANITVEQLTEEFVEYVKNRVGKEYSAKTYENYENHSKNVKAFFKRRYINSISVKDVEAFKDYLRSPEGRRSKTPKRGYSESTVKDIVTILRTIFTKAVDWGYVKENPVDSKMIPVPNKNKVDWYNAAELQLMLDKLDKHITKCMKKIDMDEKCSNKNEYTIAKERVDIFKYKVIINMAVVTGARRGEILGLTRSNINLDDKTARICQSVLYTKKKKIYLESHTKNGEDRTVGLNDYIVELLKQYYKMLDDMFECSNGIMPPNDFLFMSLRKTQNSDVGGIIFPDPVSTWFADFVEKAGMRRITFHKLRHSSLSYMLQCGRPMFEVARTAGHSVQTLIKTYGHPDEDKRLKSASIFDTFYDVNHQDGMK